MVTIGKKSEFCMRVKENHKKFKEIGKNVSQKLAYNRQPWIASTLHADHCDILRYHCKFDIFIFHFCEGALSLYFFPERISQSIWVSF